MWGRGPCPHVPGYLRIFFLRIRLPSTLNQRFGIRVYVRMVKYASKTPCVAADFFETAKRSLRFRKCPVRMDKASMRLNMGTLGLRVPSVGKSGTRCSLGSLIYKHSDRAYEMRLFSQGE